MIERLVIAATLLVLAALVGYGVKRFTNARSARLAAVVSLPATDSQSPRMLVFTTRWCSDCVTQHDLIENTRHSWSQPVQISYHDAVAESEFAKRFGILMVPALVVARPDGDIVGVRQGLVDEDRLRSLIEAAA